jgi:hypothetical protein
MKKLFLLMGIIVISVSCEKDQVNRNFDDDLSIQNFKGTWVVVSYEDFVKNSVIKKDNVDSWNGMDVILTFTTDSLYGKNTTNSVTGNFFLSDRNIHVIRYGGTKRGQPEWGNMFSDVVYNLESYKINENQLRFFYNDNKNSVTFESYQKDGKIPLIGYEEVTLIDLSGIDCCGFVFIKHDGKTLDPINVEDFLAEYIEGEKYWIKYKIAYDAVNCCMVGDLILIVELKEQAK